MLRRGFTLIELLVVITIIAILAGAAIPYVQDYVEEARYSKAKSDLDEISSALTRFELDRGTSYTAPDISELVGPYLQKSLVDPWGGTYAVSDTNSEASTNGQDGIAGNGDDITVEFRPPLALSKVYWEDDSTPGYSVGDTIVIRFTRPVDPATLGSFDGFTVDATDANAGWLGVPANPGDFTTDFKGVKLAVADATTITNLVFLPGKSVLSLNGAPVVVQDGKGNDILTAPKALIKAR